MTTSRLKADVERVHSLTVKKRSDPREKEPDCRDCFVEEEKQ